MAALMAACIGITLLLREDHGAAPATARPTLLQWLQSYVASPLRDLMRMKGWWAVLLFVVSYKLGDAALGVMTNPFLIQLGFSKIDIAQVVKLYGFAATIIGRLCSGLVRAALWGGAHAVGDGAAACTHQPDVCGAGACGRRCPYFGDGHYA